MIGSPALPALPASVRGPRLRRPAAGLALLGLLLAGPATAEPERLPDTEVTQAGALSAWLTEPTTRYGHGALGDAIEAGGLAVRSNGRLWTLTLPPTEVFEDRRVRLTDLDGDGAPEALVVLSDLRRGAALVAYRIGPRGIVELARSAPIGRANRWLNPVGVADFMGDGTRTIAAVVTPHLVGSLRLYRLRGGRIEDIARIDGYTNHINGTRDLDLAAVFDGNDDGVPDIALPTRDRRHLATVTFAGGQARELARRGR